MMRMGTARSAMRKGFASHGKVNNLQTDEGMRELSICVQCPCSPTAVPEDSTAVPGIPPAPQPCSASLNQA